MPSATRRIGVIGAGISGIVTAAHLKKENLDVTVYERSAAAGGVWYVIHPNSEFRANLGKVI